MKSDLIKNQTQEVRWLHTQSVNRSCNRGWTTQQMFLYYNNALKVSFGTRATIWEGKQILKLKVTCFEIWRKSEYLTFVHSAHYYGGLIAILIGMHCEIISLHKWQDWLIDYAPQTSFICYKQYKYWLMLLGLISIYFPLSHSARESQRPHLLNLFNSTWHRWMLISSFTDMTMTISREIIGQLTCVTKLLLS